MEIPNENIIFQEMCTIFGIGERKNGNYKYLTREKKKPLESADLCDEFRKELGNKIRQDFRRQT